MSNALLFGNKEWDYIKEYDCFYFYNVELYRQGKWAENIPERVKVKVKGSSLYAPQINNQQEIEIRFESSKPINKTKGDISLFLAQKLETYLNDTNNNQD